MTFWSTAAGNPPSFFQPGTAEREMSVDVSTCRSAAPHVDPLRRCGGCETAGGWTDGRSFWTNSAHQPQSTSVFTLTAHGAEELVGRRIIQVAGKRHYRDFGAMSRSSISQM